MESNTILKRSAQARIWALLLVLPTPDLAEAVRLLQETCGWLRPIPTLRVGAASLLTSAQVGAILKPKLQPMGVVQNGQEDKAENYSETTLGTDCQFTWMDKEPSAKQSFPLYSCGSLVALAHLGNLGNSQSRQLGLWRQDLLGLDGSVHHPCCSGWRRFGVERVTKEE